ncbi:hypothetical protein D3C72_1838920 [compost metagenome]
MPRRIAACDRGSQPTCWPPTIRRSLLAGSKRVRAASEAAMRAMWLALAPLPDGTPDGTAGGREKMSAMSDRGAGRAGASCHFQD